MNPRVSVIVVSYRSRESLPACLDSLRECAARIPLEVLVVDNASGDGTPEWLARSYPEVEVIANTENLGFTRGVNQGLTRGRGDLMLLLNPDCIVAAEALERMLDAASRGGGLAAIAPRLADASGRPARSCGRFPSLWTLFCDHLGLAQALPGSAWFGWYKYGGRELDSLDRVDWASGAALLIPRRAYQCVGGLDEKIFMYMEEVDWCRRAAAMGLGVRYVHSATVVHFGQRSARQVPGASYLHNLRSRVYYFRKHHGPFVASVAKGILIVSLALKWSASLAARAGRAAAPVYARGMGAVWAA